MNKLSHYLIFFVIILAFIPCKSEENKKEKLLKILGDFPEPPTLQIDTLESIKLNKGWRYKIEYLSEKQDTLFDTPEDRIRAYLFMPFHQKNDKLPGIIAIHQDGNPQNAHLGKLETAGIEGDTTLYYGLELFERGYIVICPDRFTHGERGSEGKPISNIQQYLFPLEKRVGQLILNGRTGLGKRIYDLMRATDILYSLDEIDTNRIGAIAHSGGGNYLVPFMFVDERVKLGVSSCGFNDLIDTYNHHYPMNVLSSMALPGLAKIGRSADYLAYLAPRPFLMTRGMWEYGRDNPQREEMSRSHVERTKNIEKHARKRYTEFGTEENFITIYFEENSGFHSFPDSVKNVVYNWIDKHLKE